MLQIESSGFTTLKMHDEHTCLYLFTCFYIYGTILLYASFKMLMSFHDLRIRLLLL